jgi:small subunit ribosomal protein S26e
MAKKRRNGGRNKNNRGYVKPIVCTNCGRLCPKDKAVKRFTIKNIVDESSNKDIGEASAFSGKPDPTKLYINMQYCISCAIHSRIVKVRSSTDRKIRTPPPRIQRDATGKIIQKKEEKK